MSRRALWLLPLLASLGGCAQFEGVKETFGALQEYVTGKDNSEPPNPLYEIKTTAKIEKIWEESIGDGYNERSLYLIPGLDGEKLFVADYSGRLEARARSTGKLIWRVDAPFTFSGGVGIGYNRLLVGTDNGELVAFNSQNGSVLWKTPVSSEILSIPQEDDGVVVVRCSDGRLYGFDARTGVRKWVYERAVGNLSVRVFGSPLLSNGVVVDGYGSGKVSGLALDDGRVLWESMVAFPKGRSEVERLVDFGGEAAVASGTVYTVGYRGGLAALDLRSGERLWHIDNVSGDSGLVANRRSIYLSDDDGDVWRFETRLGGDLWRQGDLHQRRLSAPLLLDNYVLVGDFEGYVHVLSQDDGRIVGRIQIGRDAIAPRLVADESFVYVYGKGGTLAALRIR